jgi:predicted secreted acid phosphatase
MHLVTVTNHSPQEHKNTRTQEWSQTQQILMHVGDNIEDLPGMTQKNADIAILLLQQPRTFILLPNPTYGSW